MSKVTIGNILTIGTISIFGVLITKKLNKVQKEIEYFEECKGIFANREEYEKLLKRRREEREES